MLSICSRARLSHPAVIAHREGGGLRQRKSHSFAALCGRSALATLALVVIGFDCAFAYRPLTTEDAGVAGRHRIEAEASGQFLAWPDGTREGHFLAVGIVGLTERIEVSLELPYLLHDSPGEDVASGQGDLQIVGKVSLVGELPPFPALALRGTVKTSTGDAGDGLGSGGTDYELVVAASKTAGAFSFHAMGGLTLVETQPGGTDPAIPYGVAADWRVHERLHFVTEVAGQRHPDKLADEDPALLWVGMILPMAPALSVDAAVGMGLTKRAPDVALVLGATIFF